MNRGAVVLVDWRYSDRTGSKLRPAVVVQADYLNGMFDDTILVQITTTLQGIPGTEVKLDPAVETASGLLHVSYVFCPNILTEEQVRIDQTHRVTVFDRDARDRELSEIDAWHSVNVIHRSASVVLLPLAA